MLKIHWPTIVKLLIASLVVGTIMGVIGADPFEFWEGVWELVRMAFTTIYDVGWEGIKKALYFTFIGAVVVLPIWLVLEFLKRRKPEAAPQKEDKQP